MHQILFPKEGKQVKMRKSLSSSFCTEGNPILFIPNVTTQGVKRVSRIFSNVNSITTTTTTVHNFYKHIFGDQLMQDTHCIQ
jgi:hypothetical protein